MEFKTVREVIDFWLYNNKNVRGLFKINTKVWLNKCDYEALAFALREFYGSEPCALPFNIFLPKKRKRGDDYPLLHIRQGLSERVHVLLSLYKNKNQFLKAYKKDIVLVTHHLNGRKWDARSENLLPMTYESHCELHSLKPNMMEKESIRRKMNSLIFHFMFKNSSRHYKCKNNANISFKEDLDTYTYFDLDDFTQLFVNGKIFNIYLP